MEQLFFQFIEAIGEDPHRRGLINTPHRAAAAFRYFTQGYQGDVAAIVNGAIYTAEHDGIVLVKNIDVYSLCEHHVVPFFGHASVAFLPDQKIIGLSKIARIVDLYARRLQTQEALTQQIADAIMHMIQAKGVAVKIDAQHLCMMMRGVEKQEANMVTCVKLGAFKTDNQLAIEWHQLLSSQ